MTFYRVCDTDDLRDGEMKLFELAGYEYLLARVDGKFYAVDNFCTHLGGDLSKGRVSGDRVVCPLHASEFNLATGDPVKPPADFPLETYPVKVEGHDVMIDIKF